MPRRLLQRIVFQFFLCPGPNTVIATPNMICEHQRAAVVPGGTARGIDVGLPNPRHIGESPPGTGHACDGGGGGSGGRRRTASRRRLRRAELEGDDGDAPTAVFETDLPLPSHCQ